MYITPAQGLTLTSVLRGILGICVLLFIAWLLSKDRKKIDWKIVVTGLSLQILLAFGMLYIPALQIFFEFLGKIFVKILEFTRQGTAFLAGGLLDTSKVGYIFIFQVLPTLIFFSALISLLYYLNIIQRIVQGVGWCIRKIFRLSGSVGDWSSDVCSSDLIRRAHRSRKYIFRHVRSSYIGKTVSSFYEPIRDVSRNECRNGDNIRRCYGGIYRNVGR